MFKTIIFLTLLTSDLCPPTSAFSQQSPSLNTAKDCKYMKPIEREMVYEINMVRKHPEVYIGYLQGDLARVKETLRKSGKGGMHYAVKTTVETTNGKNKVKKERIGSYENEEAVNAVESLIRDLKNLGPLSILEPDEGLYRAAVLYGKDEDRHNWELHHNGSDGSWPDERIKRASKKMIDGNENIAGKFPEPTAREIVIQLLIDSGIPGYGHRYNILNPEWTHVACFSGGLKFGMYRWLQEFGQIAK